METVITAVTRQESLKTTIEIETPNLHHTFSKGLFKTNFQTNKTTQRVLSKAFVGFLRGDIVALAHDPPNPTFLTPPNGSYIADRANLHLGDFKNWRK